MQLPSNCESLAVFAESLFSLEEGHGIKSTDAGVWLPANLPLGGLLEVDEANDEIGLKAFEREDAYQEYELAADEEADLLGLDQNAPLRWAKTARHYLHAILAHRKALNALLPPAATAKHPLIAFLRDVVVKVTEARGGER